MKHPAWCPDCYFHGNSQPETCRDCVANKPSKYVRREVDDMSDTNKKFEEYCMKCKALYRCDKTLIESADVDCYEEIK